MTQETFEQMVERIASEMPDCKLDDVSAFGHLYYFEPPELVEFATRLREELAKGQEPVAYTTKGQIAAMNNGFQHYIQGRVCRFVTPSNDDVPLYTHPVVAAPADAVAKDVERRIEEAWGDGYRSLNTYNDTDIGADDAFIKGILYAANKYEKVRGERFSGGDVADFLTMEAEEMTESDINAAMKGSK